MDLFDYMRTNTMKQESPLASRMRPETLDQVVGQKHIVGPCFTGQLRPTSWAPSFSMARQEPARPLWRK